ncbi:glycoside hydrolase family 16 protein [Exidia glandulosa HHB12029]|uniref:Glycoside hydrolase family 16 protein n=1 Tax=Exidia glandulosa HHB12029 TaxID=1314781 RepID=A0A165QAJ7_EXIGL|nr:glycoside hydrolase family 16 protein [Exidia glandulosa HHB12029]
MFGSRSLALALALASPSLTMAASYSVSDTFIGSSFLSGFDFEAISDPTHGRVQYVSQSAAQSANLTSTTSTSFVMRVESKTVLSASGAGRKSVRIQSKKQWTTHVAIIDVRHMPQGCGTWPAFWEVGANWPFGGELDIIEGVNDLTPNLSSLHTSSGCTMPASRSMKGTAVFNDCNVENGANSNQGCGVHGVSSRDFGPPFNSAGGGWFAAERTNSAIRVFFWSRQDTTVPAEVKNGSSTINTSNWGSPTALFPSTSCDIASHFGPHNIVINTSLCGDWAGNQYASSGCPSTCVDYVNNNPAAFANAYWDIAALRVYT